jgi:NADPH-dependent curcumin reductase CurA
LLQGLEEAPNGLKRLLRGENNGKVIIQVNKDHIVNPKL